MDIDQLQLFGVVTEKPITSPGEFDRKQLIQYRQNGINVWVWNSTASAWEGGQWRVMSDASSPAGVVAPDFAGQQFYDTSTNKMWYAEGTTNSDWVDFAAGSGGGGGS